MTEGAAHEGTGQQGTVHQGTGREGTGHEGTGHGGTLAAAAAEATARLTRRPGLAVLTAGPGVTNGVSAITTAQFNGSPVVILGGRAPDGRWGSGSLQEFDHPELLRPITKAAWTEHETAKIGAGVDEAFRLA